MKTASILTLVVNRAIANGAEPIIEMREDQHPLFTSKAHMYKTAYIRASGECVSLLQWHGPKTSVFSVRSKFGQEDYNARELQGYCL